LCAPESLVANKLMAACSVCTAGACAGAGKERGQGAQACIGGMQAVRLYQVAQRLHGGLICAAQGCAYLCAVQEGMLRGLPNASNCCSLRVT
jgi:hypothetical protein